MKVLVVDDDRTTRFLLRRALITEFGCAVTEANDGIDALEALAKTRYQLVILDVQMPVMDGLETLRALRDAPDCRALPVVMLTAERNENVVQQIIALGVLDYMTKPLVADRIVERLRRVIRWLATESEWAADRRAPDSRAGLEDTASLLIADGSEDFRRFFAETLGTRRTVITAETGARAFRTCLESSPGAVFIGSGLGVLSDALLLRKIRSTPAIRDTFLIAVMDKEEDPSARLAGYDGRITRTFVPEAFIRQFESLSSAESEALRALLTVHPGLRVTLISAAEQVFGMMLGTEVGLRDPTPAQVAERVAVSATATWRSGEVVHLRGCCDVATGRRMAANLLALDPGMVHDEDVDAAVSEVFTLISGRLRNTLVAKGVPFEVDTPGVRRSSGPVGVPADGISLCFQSPGKDVEFWLMLDGEPRAPALDAAAAVESPAEAAIAP